jgi:chromosome segregation ATPase
MKNPLLIVVPVILAFLCGCSGMGNPVKIVLPPDFSEPPKSAAKSERFEQPGKSASSALESAMEMSEKYAQLSIEAAELKQNKQAMQSERNNLRDQLINNQAKLNQTELELKQANDLIIEMRVELNNWKSDVLGFRDEMREADITQLQTLQQILETLGGELPGELVAAETTNISGVPAAEPNQPVHQTN